MAKIRKIGEVRQSQALTTFGIGAIVDFRFHSVMPLGLESWPPKNSCSTIHEPDLERILEKRWFQAPPVEDESSSYTPMLKATRFPRWMFCPECYALGMVRDIGPEQPTVVDVTSVTATFCFQSVKSGKVECLRTRKGRKCKGIAVPTRLVTVCYAEGEVGGTEHKGHIEDFPWFLWVHHEHNYDKKKPHYMKLIPRKRTLAIDDLMVHCSCGIKPRSLSGVFSKDALRGLKNCDGWRPWLEGFFDKEKCGRPLKAFLRGATNLHMPVTTSVISIPPYTSKLHEEIGDYIDDLAEKWEDDCEDRAELGYPSQSVSKFAERQLKRLREKGFDRDKVHDDDEVIASIADRLSGNDDTRHDRTSATGRRFAECTAIRLGDNNPNGNFDAKPLDVPDEWSAYLSRIVQVRKLRAVQALRGFRRDAMGNPDQQIPDSHVAPLSRQPFPWLPAIEMRGEGIFVELNLESVQKWEKRDAVIQRMKKFEANYNSYAEQEKWEDAKSPSPRFVLVHSFAHMLIRQLTLECGYSSASLKERIYVATPDDVDENPDLGGEMAGCLIYTSTTDSDGSYGGLVRMGEEKRFSPMLLEALRSVTWCSSDPVCSSADGQGYMGLNRAACHACALVPETSCEYRNVYLDRVLAVTTLGMSDAVAFFDSNIFTK